MSEYEASINVYATNKPPTAPEKKVTTQFENICLKKFQFMPLASSLLFLLHCGYKNSIFELFVPSFLKGLTESEGHISSGRATGIQ